jgi:hypothetical protein
MDIKTAELGQDFTIVELKNQCKAIYGGVSWPSKRPGFAVVLGMSRDKHFDNYDIFLLDEFEHMDMWELIKQCGVLDFKYQPTMWIGDRLNDAADHFIDELNISLRRPEKSNQEQQHFSVYSTPILDMQHPYPYIMSEIKKLVDKERRQLFLKDSMIKNYLGIKLDEVAELQLGDYPTLEALAFAVIELREYGRQIDMPRRRRKQMRSPMRMC